MWPTRGKAPAAPLYQEIIAPSVDNSSASSHINWLCSVCHCNSSTAKLTTVREGYCVENSDDFHMRVQMFSSSKQLSLLCMTFPKCRLLKCCDSSSSRPTTTGRMCAWRERCTTSAYTCRLVSLKTFSLQKTLEKIAPIDNYTPHWGAVVPLMDTFVRRYSMEATKERIAIDYNYWMAIIAQMLRLHSFGTMKVGREEMEMSQSEFSFLGQQQSSGSLR